MIDGINLPPGQASAILIGVNAVNCSGYPDCRPEFIAAIQALGRVATKQGVEGNAVRIEAPLIGMTKAEIIRRGNQLGVDFSLPKRVRTSSAYWEPLAHSAFLATVAPLYLNELDRGLTGLPTELDVERLPSNPVSSGGEIAEDKRDRW